MTKRESLLAVFATAIVRELLRESVYEDDVVPATARQPVDPDPNPHPQFDFDESGDVCEHNGIWLPKHLCIIHGAEAQAPAPTDEELEDITGETAAEANPLIARAERKRRQRETAQRNTPLYPEEIPMSGVVGRPPDDPPLVV
jgi:hypothetical protein